MNLMTILVIQYYLSGWTGDTSNTKEISSAPVVTGDVKNCYEHSECTGDTNVCINRRCVCGAHGARCSQTNPTCDHSTGICQCGPKKNKWGGPAKRCFLGQVCVVLGEIGKCANTKPGFDLTYLVP